MGLKKSVRWIPPALKKCFLGVRKMNPKEIPIVINNFNRLETLLKLIAGLEKRGYHNIYIIDNDSTYPPLLKFYIEECKYPIYFLHRNVGYLAIWETGIYKQFRDSYFVYTDSDVEIHPDCPDDFIARFISLLKKHPTVMKVGFSICIDDLPDHFDLKQQVCQWESQFWKREVEKNVFKAAIDTTFAVHEPYIPWYRNAFKIRCLRVGFPYSIRHLPWYVDSKNPTDEQKYYVDHIKTKTHWSEQTQ